MIPLPKKAHWPPFYIYLQSAAIALTVWYLTYAHYEDDAYISLTYARNVLSGQGLTWHGERIEGYSNFLFILLTALLGVLGSDLKIASIVIGFASYFGLVAVIHSYVSGHFRTYFLSNTHSYAHHINHAICTGLVASAAIILAWCSGGLEMVFFAFLLTSCICLILRWITRGCSNRYAFAAGVLFALTAMTRIEAATIWAVTGLFIGAVWLLKKNSHITFRHLFLFGAGFTLFFAPYMGWRLWYFGEWLPNTYWAKLYGIPSDKLIFSGLFYFLQFAIMPPMLTVFAAILFIMCVRRKSISTEISYLAILVLIMSAQIIRAGGDYMQYLRFFVPVVPLLALLIYHCNTVIIPHNEKRFRDICGALIIFSIMQFGMVRMDENPSPGAISGTAVSEYVKTHWPKDSLIAINTAGALPYLAPNQRYLDMLGLLDKHIARREFITKQDMDLAASYPIAHIKGDGNYVLSRKPDYIIFSNAAWGSTEPLYLSDKEIYESPEFKKHYEKIEAYITPPENLLESLRRMSEERTQIYNQLINNADKGTEEYKKLENPPDFIRNPVLNEQNQLRFTYYQRKKDR